MKTNKNLELIKQLTKEPPRKTERKTMRQCLRDTLHTIAQNETFMNEAKEKNPELYDLTMKVYFEEEWRRQEERRNQNEE